MVSSKFLPYIGSSYLKIGLQISWPLLYLPQNNSNLFATSIIPFSLLLRPLSILFLSLLILSCGTTGLYISSDERDWENSLPPNENEIIYQVFLIGDAGAPKLDGDPTLTLFENHLKEASEYSAAVFLGDNIYNYGLPDSTDPQRAFYERRIVAQLETVQDFKGRVVFVPGNHDWDDGRADGLNAVRRQERFIEEYLDRGNTFLPDNGFPGPHEIKLMDEDDHPDLNEDIRLVALDTHWWLHEHEKPYGDNGDFNVNDAGDVINELEDIIRDRKKDYLIVAAHHPLVSNEAHGGYFPLSTHFKPPIFGSLYVLYRRIFGLKQDIPHHRYSSMVRSIRSTFREKEDVIYVAGHSHTLQYHKTVQSRRYNTHHIVSGSGSKTDYVANGKGAHFAYGGQGFVTLNIYTDGSLWMEAWIPNDDGSEGELIYRTMVQGPNSRIDEPEVIEDREEILANTETTIAANPNYDRGGFLYRGLLGANRREMWSVESEYPIFDVTKIEGGLEPVRYGGRGQSNTLHLNGEDGKEFVLRSVDKQAGKVWSEELRQSFALDAAQDQFSMLNPFAALVVAELAKPIGVYHTNPEYFIVPDDPMLGGYGDLMAGELGLFERKPDNDMSDVSSVGNAEDVISSIDFLREVDNDIDHRVDQPLLARSRLFDMLIGDWDRHSDQWRWAAVEPEDEQGKIYQPIPRDRDVALMRLDGLIPTLAKLGPFAQYQNFDYSYGNLKGLNLNSLGLTRRFTNQLSRDEWIKIAEDIKAKLTDAQIEQAVAAYPDEIEEKFGQETIEILKARRDQLPEIARIYSSQLDKVVTIPASHKRERILINILDEDRIQVQVYKLTRKGNLREIYFDRTFNDAQTNELRIFAMGDDDEIIVSGNERPRINIRIIGGSGNDTFVDQNPEVRRNIDIYDTEITNTDAESRSRFNFSDNSEINRFDYNHDYQWNSTMVGFFFAFNDDDGLFIGGGPRFTKHGFRKIPDQKHYIRANYAPITGAGNIRYTGDWYQFSGNWHGNVEGTVLLPESYRYFFGLGNNTRRQDQLDSDFYRARLEQYSVFGTASILLQDVLDFHIGGGIQYTNVDDVQGEQSILNDPRLGINPNIFDSQYYGQLSTGVSITDVDNPVNPQYGFKLSLNSIGNLSLNDESETHLNLSGSTSFYASGSGKRQFTFAGRFGSEHIIGSFPFYQANTLGATQNLRGFTNQRFTGRTTVYSNAEIRLELVDFYRYLFGGKGGILTFFDAGRVWTDGENSSTIHQGYGGGIWFNIFNQMLISATYGTSGDENSFEIKAGFFF